MHKFHISRGRLIDSKVVGVHFSKNILLSDGLNCPMVLNQLKKALDTNLKQDFSENEELIFIQSGDKIKVFYQGSDNGINDIISVER